MDIDLLKKKAAAHGDVTHEEIARRAGIDRSAVTRVFAGTVPTLANTTALAWAYDIKLDELVPRARDKVEVPA
ncbi:helix-turn-helix transcriptional regulator [Streptomyces sp. NPDC019990]|uniref:helix-turn-helix domain-containing protein n=1 Tax=Streptomyces sp. NPDC019990 TaxID=3154693 RepID=UPI0033E8D805